MKMASGEPTIGEASARGGKGTTACVVWASKRSPAAV